MFEAAVSQGLFSPARQALLALRRNLNEKLSAYARRATDVDADGRLFVRFVLPFACGALLVRAVYDAAAGVPDWSGEAHTSALPLVCAAFLAMSFVTQRYRLVEAALIMRSGAFSCLAVPFATSMVVFVYHTGRQFPLIDDNLAALDHMLGFDWLTYVKWFDVHPLAWRASRFFYDSILWQFPLSVLCLAFTRAARRLYTYMCAQVLSLILVAAIACVLPALGTYAHFDGAHAGFLHKDFVTTDNMTASILWLRNDAFGPGGITCFTLILLPSYHAVCAVLFAFATWRIPYVRWISLALNLGMLLATPVQGSHYLADIIAGVLVAAVSLSACSRFLAARRATAPARLSTTIAISPAYAEASGS